MILVNPWLKLNNVNLPISIIMLPTFINVFAKEVENRCFS